MHGAIPLLPTTPLWLGVYLKMHRDNFTFTFAMLFNVIQKFHVFISSVITPNFMTIICAHTSEVCTVATLKLSILGNYVLWCSTARKVEVAILWVVTLCNDKNQRFSLHVSQAHGLIALSRAPAIVKVFMRLKLPLIFTLILFLLVRSIRINFHVR
jgi:hypothetical protein